MVVIRLTQVDFRRQRRRSCHGAAVIHCTWTSNDGDAETELGPSTMWTAAFNASRRTGSGCGRLLRDSSNGHELYGRTVEVGVLALEYSAATAAGGRNIWSFADGLWIAPVRGTVWGGFRQQSSVKQVWRQTQRSAAAAAGFRTIFTVVRSTEHDKRRPEKPGKIV